VGGWIAATVFDVSGVLAAGALAVTGLAILPYKKRQLKTDLRVRFFVPGRIKSSAVRE
jgi:hypothetical protein